MPTPKTTSNITYGEWTTIQMSVVGGDFADAAPLDDVSGIGAGPHLVFDQGIWKYPQQASAGRIAIPTTLSRPLRPVNMMFDLGASVPVTVTIAHDQPNVSGEPYAAGQEALYRTGDIVIYSETTRYAAVNLDVLVSESASLIWPGQKLFITTTGAVNPLVRFTFSLAA